jgi:anti-sigma B factor antagonist
VTSPSPYTIAEGASTERVRVLTLEGELDLAAAPRLQARVDETPSGQALVLDLSRATFIDSAVLKELLRARAELSERDVRLVLAGVAPPVRRLLDLTRTSELFEDAASVDEALKRLS